MLTLQDIKQIQADARKAVTRQFRDAAEDQGWKPDEWHPDGIIAATAHTEGDAAAQTPAPAGNAGNAPAGPGIQELRDKAKELGLSAGGSKEALQGRIAAAQTPAPAADTAATAANQPTGDAQSQTDQPNSNEENK